MYEELGDARADDDPHEWAARGAAGGLASAGRPSRPNLKALVLRGNGGTFCAGADFSLARDLATSEDGLLMYDLMKNTLDTLRDLPVISVAAVEGAAMGGGECMTGPRRAKPRAGDLKLNPPTTRTTHITRPCRGGACDRVRLAMLCE